ncbi:hypothetical protein IFM89_038165 [Coptis chinensis]|uniref:diacylglycerol O-acyltransferase n=1 Tax=Coptis chinensis TaxID=261450 RepID=A0A835HR13_9MAGN|nr:hypothetical protein IFM89_038165 [Coptis chinensis]
MDFNKPIRTLKVEEDEETLLPVSPSGQCLSNSTLTLTILFVAELETSFDEFETTEIIRNVFLPLNARFSSILVDNDEKGSPAWKKVDVRVEDHIIVPTFPIGLTDMEYDEKLREYVSKIAGERLSSNQPLWEVHLVKYPNMYGAGSLVFKFSHALGDGFSIVGVIFSAIKRADDPSLPLTLPDMSLSIAGMKKGLWNYVTRCINTVSDLRFSILKGTGLEDSKSAVRSGMVGVEFEPIAISTISIPMERLKLIKAKIGGVSAIRWPNYICT